MAGPRTVRRPLSHPRVRRSVLRILRGSVLCSMATVAPGGVAHINTAYFAYSPDVEMYFVSDPGALHCRNLGRNPSMAMTVFRSDQVWGKPDRGMQLFGECREAKGRDAHRAERFYGRRFPPYVRILQGTSREDRSAAALLRSYRFYRFVPRRVKILDEREFGGGVFVVAALPRRRRRGTPRRP